MIHGLSLVSKQSRATDSNCECAIVITYDSMCERHTETGRKSRLLNIETGKQSMTTARCNIHIKSLWVTSTNDCKAHRPPKLRCTKRRETNSWFSRIYIWNPITHHALISSPLRKSPVGWGMGFSLRIDTLLVGFKQKNNNASTKKISNSHVKHLSNFS